MRFAATVLLWLVTTLALAVAIPAAWVQQNVVDVDGYAAMAQKAAADPALQSAMAAELTAQAMALIAKRGYSVDSSVVRGAASSYTAGPSFPPQFAQANRVAHRWMFSDTQGQSADTLVLDLAAMLNDSSIQQMLADYHVQVPATVPVVVPVDAPKTLRPGMLRPLARWGPTVSIGVTAVAVVGALLTLVAARGRGKALSSLGVSALLVGAGGWAGIEVARRYLDDALNHTTGDIRRIADDLVGHVEGSLHQWLDMTLAAGAALVVLGVLIAIVGSLGKRN